MMNKFIIEIEIIPKNKVEESDINALLKGCKYLNFSNYFFKINSYRKEEK